MDWPLCRSCVDAGGVLSRKFPRPPRRSARKRSPASPRLRSLAVGSAVRCAAAIRRAGAAREVLRHLIKDVEESLRVERGQRVWPEVRAIGVREAEGGLERVQGSGGFRARTTQVGELHRVLEERTRPRAMADEQVALHHVGDPHASVTAAQRHPGQGQGERPEILLAGVGGMHIILGARAQRCARDARARVLVRDELLPNLVMARHALQHVLNLSLVPEDGAKVGPDRGKALAGAHLDEVGAVVRIGRVLLEEPGAGLEHRTSLAGERPAYLRRLAMRVLEATGDGHGGGGVQEAERAGVLGELEEHAQVPVLGTRLAEAEAVLVVEVAQRGRGLVLG
mmetsp:Transcript_15585/g.39297  ORF Transcript_15585/g.39297 Transcript_15585/m.39297 type:complete len:339 (-) Transcript_15585:17-1033(-)